MREMNGMKESERKRERERSFKTSIIRRVRSFEGTTILLLSPFPPSFFIQFSFPSSGNESKSPDLPPNADPNFLDRARRGYGYAEQADRRSHGLTNVVVHLSLHQESTNDPREGNPRERETYFPRIRFTLARRSIRREREREREFSAFFGTWKEYSRWST